MEKTKRIGKPEENPKNNNRTNLISKYMEKASKLFLINLNRFFSFHTF